MTASQPEPRPASLTPLFVAAAALLPVGLVITAYTLLSDSFYSHPPVGITLLGYAIGFVVAATAPIWLAVRAMRAQRRFGSTGTRTAGVVTGLSLAAIAVVFTGLPFAATAAEIGFGAVQKLTPLSDAESETSVTDLRQLAREFLDDSVSGIDDVERPSTDSSNIIRDDCRLSNGHEGTRLISLGELFLTSEDSDDAIESIADEWHDMGYAVSSGDDFARLQGKGFLDEAEVVWVVRHESSTEEGPMTYNLDVTFTTICVAD